jgi:hypothetical protein
MAPLDRGFFDQCRTAGSCCKIRHRSDGPIIDRCATYHYDALHANDLRFLQCSCTLLHLHFAELVKIGHFEVLGAASFTEVSSEGEQYRIRWADVRSGQV